MSEATKETIRKLNDELRFKTPFLPKPHRCVMTQVVAELPSDSKVELFSLIRDFNNFNADNDPYNEHDAGIVSLGDEDYYWKFDYYDDTYEYHVDNGNRVLTIMSLSEY